MPSKESEKAIHEKSDKSSCYEVQIYSPRVSSPPLTVRTIIEEDESVSLLTERIVKPYLKDVIIKQFASTSICVETNVIVDYGNGRMINHSLSSSLPDDSTTVKKVHARLFVVRFDVR
jgi:hypothetical protein